jgi:hypothetical protein
MQTTAPSRPAVPAAPPVRRPFPVAPVLRVVGAGSLAVSAWVHQRLYVDDGYRDIHLDRVLGIDLSRSILLQVITAAVVAAALLVSLRVQALALPASAVGALVSLGSLGAYYQVRNNDLLGFTEARWTTDAKVAVASEVIGVVVLVAAVVVHRAAVRRPRPERMRAGASAA